MRPPWFGQRCALEWQRTARYLNSPSHLPDGPLEKPLIVSDFGKVLAFGCRSEAERTNHAVQSMVICLPLSPRARGSVVWVIRWARSARSWTLQHWRARLIALPPEWFRPKAVTRPFRLKPWFGFWCLNGCTIYRASKPSFNSWIERRWGTLRIALARTAQHPSLMV